VTESSTSAPESGAPFSGRTAWLRHMDTPLRAFLRTETGSASVLAGATVAALVWANISASSYDRLWATRLSVLVGGWGVTLDLREFVNSGLMALFFLVAGLELAQSARDVVRVAISPNDRLAQLFHPWSSYQGALTTRDLIDYARALRLDIEKFTSDLRRHAGAAHIAEDVDSADLSGVSGTPTFFVNGMRHYGAYDIESLSKAVKLALARVKISAA
jgi:Na+/H+ antiporter 1/DSBA-like thioredoxin domain